MIKNGSEITLKTTKEQIKITDVLYYEFTSYLTSAQKLLQSIRDNIQNQDFDVSSLNKEIKKWDNFMEEKEVSKFKDRFIYEARLIPEWLGEILVEKYETVATYGSSTWWLITDIECTGDGAYNYLTDLYMAAL
jgi:hypothetical protein